MIINESDGWMQVSSMEENDDGELEEVVKECDRDDCEGTVYTNRGEMVCGECSLMHSVMGFDLLESGSGQSFVHEEAIGDDRDSIQRPTYDHQDNTVRLYGGFHDAYKGDGDYEFGSYDDDGLTIHHLRDWERGGGKVSA